MNKKQILKDGLGWGLGLWFVGYILGFIFFVLVSPDMIGWVIMPIGIIVTLWVLFKKINADSFKYYILLAIIWTFIAIFCDYFFLVKALKPADGYYKLDVYIYYSLTLVLPIIVGWLKKYKNHTSLVINNLK